MSSLLALLTSVSMQQYYDSLKRNGFDTVHAFSLCDDADLQVCEVTLLGHRKVLLALAETARASANSGSSLTTGVESVGTSPLYSSDASAMHGRSRAATFTSMPSSPLPHQRGRRVLRAQPSSAVTIHAVPVAPLTYSQNFWTRARAREVPWDFDLPVFEDAESQPKLRIFLVRHGQSMANIDHSLYKQMADHAIPLSPLGEKQALEAGRSFRKFMERNGGAGEAEHVRLWTSTYKRARQTAYLFRSGAGDCISDMREDVLLGEQQWGLFEGYDWKGEQISADFPSELAYYRKATEHGGRFWAKVPLGESRFDVCMRVRLFFGTLFRDAYRHGITNVVIVSHGVTIRAFMMMFLHLTPEWLEVEPNPKNASVRVLENCMDAGYIWSGPEHPRPDLLVDPSALDPPHVEEFVTLAPESPRASIRRSKSSATSERDEHESQF
jgi:2,3-bisphosphoglycerate-dependent phosphoglycerate mutase